MAHSSKRGRWLYFAVVIPVVIHQVANLALGLSRPWAEIAWFRGILIPLVLISLCYALWFGNKSMRNTIAFWLLLEVLMSTFLIVMLARVMFLITPPEAMDGFFFITPRVLAIPLAITLFYWWAALIVAFSPSLKAFLEFQELKDRVIGVSPIGWLFGKFARTCDTRLVGKLPLPSGVLLLADIQYLPGLEVTGFQSQSADVILTRTNPDSEHPRVDTVRVVFETTDAAVERRKLGEVPIDSAKLICFDRNDFERDWTEVGLARTGKISVMRDNSLLDDLTERFDLEIEGGSRTHVLIKGPVSEELETNINNYLKTKPEYAVNTFIYFEVQTDSSFDRANYDVDDWAFLPVGNDPDTMMFACSTGYGDGKYDVIGEYAAGRLVALQIDFVTAEQTAKLDSLLGG